MSRKTKGARIAQPKFLGRETELEDLKSAWREAISGKSQMRILAAESGYGKTKLVQAFYAWLSANHDAENYWPSSLGEEGQNLRVMPQLARVKAGKKAPWFWWGMRWIDDPDGRNLPEEPSPFISTINDPSFTSHQSAILLSVNEKKALNEVIFASCKVVLGIVGAGLPKDVCDAVEQVQGFLGILKRRKVGVDLSKGKDAAESQARERVLTTFALLLDPFKGNKGSLPVIVVLDDAHWMDALSITIIDQLWCEACARSWPLFIIATTWQKEWNEGTKFSDWAKPKVRQHSKNARLLRLKRLPDNNILQMLSAVCPGLTDNQRQFFATKANGNPLHAMQITKFLECMAQFWFEDGDVTRALTEKGFASAQKKKYKLQELEQERFIRVETSVRDVLGAGSTQGEVFLGEFALEVARQLELHGADKVALKKAEDPFALAEAVDSESMEFRSRFLHELAKDHLLSVRNLESTALSDAIAKAAQRWISEGKIQKMREDIANRLLGCVAAASPARTDQVCATAHALALFGKDTSGWFLAEWIPRWLGLNITAGELKSVAADVLRDTAKALWKAGEKEEGLEVALELEQRARNSTDPSERARYLILSTYMKGELKHAPTDEIIRNYKEVVRLRQEAARSKKDAKSWRRLARTHNAFGRFLVLNQASGKETQEEQARGQFRSAIQASQNAVEKQPTEKNMIELAFSLRYMAEFLRQSSTNSPDAAGYSSESVQLYRTIIGRFGYSASKVEGLAYALWTQASVELDRGNYVAAVEFADEAIKELEVLQQNGIRLSNFSLYECCLRTKACCLLEISGAESASKCLQAALQACEEALSIMPEHPDLLSSKTQLTALIGQMRD